MKLCTVHYKSVHWTVNSTVPVAWVSVLALTQSCTVGCSEWSIGLCWVGHSSTRCASYKHTYLSYSPVTNISPVLWRERKHFPTSYTTLNQLISVFHCRFTNNLKMAKKGGSSPSLHKVIMVGSGGVGKSALTLQVKI